jgi:hypothetical protein
VGALLVALAWQHEPLLATAGVAVVMATVTTAAVRTARSLLGGVAGVLMAGAFLASIYLVYCDCR